MFQFYIPVVILKRSEKKPKENLSVNANFSAEAINIIVCANKVAKEF